MHVVRRGSEGEPSAEEKSSGVLTRLPPLCREGADSPLAISFLRFVPALPLLAFSDLLSFSFFSPRLPRSPSLFSLFRQGFLFARRFISASRSLFLCGSTWLLSSSPPFLRAILSFLLVDFLYPFIFFLWSSPFLLFLPPPPLLFGLLIFGAPRLHGFAPSFALAFGRFSGRRVGLLVRAVLAPGVICFGEVCAWERRA